ncbi:MAG: cell division protein FtsA, partial [Candidatus Aenigmarchaeota archaeon]|nr:cell division protein FtsA [Candidatus Aenigmarchaeota archaeon]
MSKDIITGLDLGSGLIKIAVGQIQPDKQLRVIGAVECSSEGISKGIVTNLEDTVASISAGLEKTERLVGIPINSAIVGISGTHIISQDSRGVAAINQANGEIKRNDIERALEAAQSIATPPNYEIIHVIPRNFVVDDQRGIKDPLGMTGIRLEVNAQVIEGLTSQIKNLTKCLYRAGINIDDLVFSILATAEAVLDKQQKELGVCVVDLGNTTTSLTVLEENDVLTAKVLPIGSRHITADLAIGLRVGLDLAEKVKLNYAFASPEDIKEEEKVYLSDLSSAETAVVSKKQIAEITNARLEEIFKMVNDELRLIGRAGKLPAGVVLTGAGAKLPGLVEVAKQVFKLPVMIGYPHHVISSIDKVNDPSFANVIGLLLWEHHLHQFSTPTSLKTFSNLKIDFKNRIINLIKK